MHTTINFRNILTPVNKMRLQRIKLLVSCRAVRGGTRFMHREYRKRKEEKYIKTYKLKHYYNVSASLNLGQLRVSTFMADGRHLPFHRFTNKNANCCTRTSQTIAGTYSNDAGRTSFEGRQTDRHSTHSPLCNIVSLLHIDFVCDSVHYYLYHTIQHATCLLLACYFGCNLFTAKIGCGWGAILARGITICRFCKE